MRLVLSSRGGAFRAFNRYGDPLNGDRFCHQRLAFGPGPRKRMKRRAPPPLRHHLYSLRGDREESPRTFPSIVIGRLPSDCVRLVFFVKGWYFSGVQSIRAPVEWGSILPPTFGIGAWPSQANEKAPPAPPKAPPLFSPCLPALVHVLHLSRLFPSLMGRYNQTTGQTTYQTYGYSGNPMMAQQQAIPVQPMYPQPQMQVGLILTCLMLHRLWLRLRRLCLV